MSFYCIGCGLSTSILIIIIIIISWSHVGHISSKDCDDECDILNRSSSFIAQINNIICTFGKLEEETV